MSVEAVDVYDLLLIRETAQAVLVRRQDADVEDVDWIPKSQISHIQYGGKLIDEKTSKQVTEIKAMTIPKWLHETKEHL